LKQHDSDEHKAKMIKTMEEEVLAALQAQKAKEAAAAKLLPLLRKAMEASGNGVAECHRQYD
jgi:hypothetical protein